METPGPAVMVVTDRRSWGRDELGEGLEELERREQQLGAAVDVRLGEAINQAALGRGKGGARVEGVLPFEREGWAGAVADESLDPGTVLTLDAYGGVDAEAGRALPGEHAGGIELVEEFLAPEVAQDAFLDHRLHLSDAIGRQVIGLVKRDLAVVGLAEDAVEHDEVVTRVDVEGGAERMKEADGSELCARWNSWAGAPARVSRSVRALRTTRSASFRRTSILLSQAPLPHPGHRIGPATRTPRGCDPVGMAHPSPMPGCKKGRETASHAASRPMTRVGVEPTTYGLKVRCSAS
jgi:hypothetical protein